MWKQLGLCLKKYLQIKKCFLQQQKHFFHSALFITINGDFIITTKNEKMKFDFFETIKKYFFYLWKIMRKKLLWSTLMSLNKLFVLLAAKNTCGLYCGVVFFCDQCCFTREPNKFTHTHTHSHTYLYLRMNRRRNYELICIPLNRYMKWNAFPAYRY